jgi:hypothetical protein
MIREGIKAYSMDQIATLAALVHQKLVSAKQPSPGPQIIGNVLQVVYMTSMKKEESEPLRCCVVFLDPKTKPEGTDPSTDSWKAFPLANPVPLDARHLAKLSQSADPSAIVLAVFPNEKGELLIWGFLDQVAAHSLRFATWETNRAQTTPGAFHVAVNGVADITVYHSMSILAALKQDALVERYDAVLHKGPIYEHLKTLASQHILEVQSYFSNIATDVAGGTLSLQLGIAVARILLTIQKYRHGGALLIAGDTAANVNVKHRLLYDRLPRAISHFAAQVIREDNVNHKIYDHLLPGDKSVPSKVFREHVRADFGVRECQSEMAGCVKFIGSLSRVDGLVLMDRGLVIHGFGVEIIDVPEIATLYLADDEHGTVLREIPATEYGTRHRSMFRYCNAHEDSLGFVVSQDGLIRSIKRVGEKLIMWENVQVLLSFSDEECTDAACSHCRVEETASMSARE